MNVITHLKPREQFPVKVPENPLQARLAIAQDVIRHIKAGKLDAVRGTYIGFTDWDAEIESEFEQLAVSLYESKGQSKTRCDVCAIGAATMVAVGLYDQCETLTKEWEHNYEESGCTVDDISLDAEGMHETLGQWFSEKQLGLIECAFEANTGFGMSKATQEERQAAADFRPSEDFSAEDALQDIFQNILDNNGTFKP